MEYNKFQNIKCEIMSPMLNDVMKATHDSNT